MTRGDKKRQRKTTLFLGDFQHLRLSKLVSPCQALSLKKFVRDVGVEGSNPFTPTIIFPRVFSRERAEIGTAIPETVPAWHSHDLGHAHPHHASVHGLYAYGKLAEECRRLATKASSPLGALASPSTVFTGWGTVVGLSRLDARPATCPLHQ